MLCVKLKEVATEVEWSQEFEGQEGLIKMPEHGFINYNYTLG